MRKLIISCLLLASLGVTCLLPLQAAAVDRTNSDISFTEDRDPTAPKDPADPSKAGPIGDTDNQATGSEGPLSLDVVPTVFDFGQAKVAVKEQTYSAETTTNVQYLQVTDKRTDRNGWTLTAERNEFHTQGNTLLLTGSTLIFPAGTVKNELTQGGTPDGLVTTSVEMIADTSYTMFSTASNGATIGKLTSTKYWAGADVQLKVPAMTAKVGDYTATINWTLAATTTR